jgi:hypothetical protein
LGRKPVFTAEQEAGLKKQILKLGNILLEVSPIDVRK